MSVFRNIDGTETDAVRALLTQAFDGPGEADLVAALRASGDMEHEWVLDGDDGPLAYAALSRMVAPKGWLCLAPVGVWPAHQGVGHGLRLMQKIAGWNAARGHVIVVLGQVSFYERAGFSKARAQALTSPYPLAHTMLMGPGDDTPQATLVYPRVFAGLE